ncbi:MAG TPA: hypothetical protein VGF99_21060, partial [Myxococcota bacterium]
MLRSSRRSAFTLIEVVGVAAIAGTLAIAAGANISSSMRQARARDDAAAVTNGLRLMRSQALRKGLAAALNVSPDGQTVHFGVVSPNTGCADFAGNPATANTLNTVRLSESRLNLEQGGPTNTVCFSALSFMPTAPGSGSIVTAVVDLVDADTGAGVTNLEVAQTGGIAVEGEPYVEGVATTSLRVTATADLQSSMAVLPTSAATPGDAPDASPKAGTTDMGVAGLPPPGVPADTAPPPIGAPAAAPTTSVPVPPPEEPPASPPPVGGGGG